jgi:hypothetical protein
MKQQGLREKLGGLFFIRRGITRAIMLFAPENTEESPMAPGLAFLCEL